MAAHIAAASEGGPRYDGAQTRDQRKSAENGIWLCESHAKLIDSDETTYTVPLLLSWKAETEADTQQMLATGVPSVRESLVLDVPESAGPDNLLSFSNIDVPTIGREAELRELENFLARDEPIIWWAWTGQAGSGKSRLALELCRSAQKSGWNAGFINQSEQSRLGGLQNRRPTLVVVDYAAERVAWIADALAQLAGRQGGAPVRVLVLERESSGAWWDAIESHQKLRERYALLKTMHGNPRHLEGLSKDESRSVIRNTALHLGQTELTASKVERVVDRALLIDPELRPLFAQVATFDFLSNPDMTSTHGDKTGNVAETASQARDDVLTHVLQRSLSRITQFAGEPNAAGVKNLVTLCSLLGGIPLRTYESLRNHLPAGLLPSIYQPLGSLRIEELIEGMKPDILGERLVLDGLSTDGVWGLASERLALLAFETDPDAFGAFVERAAADHPEHPGLLQLIRACESTSDTQRLLEVGISTFNHLRDRSAPMVSWIQQRTAELAAENPTTSFRQLLTLAQFKIANLTLTSESANAALGLFSEALDASEPHWQVTHEILNNRGIAHLWQDDWTSACADFTAVIDSADATDEVRACALNNRADIRAKFDDVNGSIADRSSILELEETTYNRRFIALIRRSNALHEMGSTADADADIDKILNSPDIAIEQKMSARLTRANRLIEEGAIERAIDQLEVVISSHHNFDKVESEAHEKLSQLVSG